ncbi:MAG TPA: hypothetical protein VK724_13255 [Bryobacteraceae bacterium]|nr:hypothetical protein [Bryobacteraceae bacterium]
MILLGINLYICRGLFTKQTAVMNSMHGFWAAIAQWADGSWLHPTWWPFWDGGIPFEFTYSPLVPALTGITSAAFHISGVMAVQYVTAVAYCLVPVTLFLMAWLTTGAIGYSFLAGLFYSLTSPTQPLIADYAGAPRSLWGARRLFMVVIWDDTPHVLALVFLPLAILFLVLSVQRRKPIYYAGAAFTIALATAASSFAPIVVAMASLCLLAVLQRENWKRNIVIIAGIGSYAYALSAPFLSPSLLKAIRIASRSEEGWTQGSIPVIAIVLLGWVVLWRYVPHWIAAWQLQFFVLFAYLASSVPLAAAYLHRNLLPQPVRYKFEMEMALVLLAVFGVRSLLVKAPQWMKVALLVICLGVSARQVVFYRRIAKALIQPGNLENTIEGRAALWADHNLRGARVYLPGSIWQWANVFAPIQQFTGGSWSMAYNPVQQDGAFAARKTENEQQDARISLDWLKAYGVGAVCIPGPKSPEYWKPFLHPGKFEGVLPVLWRSDDTTIYQIPQRTKSLAHVVPEGAVVRDAPWYGGDVAAMERYDAALDDASMPAAQFRWDGRNRIHIRTTANAGQVITVQVNYHPGWHAVAGGRVVQIHKDGLGLMWLRPGCNGPCEVDLEYDGGWELRLCRWLSYAALSYAALAGLMLGRKGKL